MFWSLFSQPFEDTFVQVGAIDAASLASLDQVGAKAWAVFCQARGLAQVQGKDLVPDS